MKKLICLLGIGYCVFALSALSASANMPVSLAGLDPNEQATIAPINSQIPFLGPLPPLAAAIEALPASAQPGAIDQLSPEKFGFFTSTQAFNDADFEIMAMDAYLAGQREGPNGNFLGSSGGIDASGLTINNPDVDPALAMTHSRMLAWNPGPLSGGLLSDTSASVLGGTEMRDDKDMKSMEQAAYSDPWHFFVRGNVVLGQGFSQQDLPHFDYNTSGVTVGTDYRITPHVLVGLTARYAHTDATIDTSGSSVTVDTYSPGLYASYADHGWYADVVGDYLHNAYTQSRVIEFLSQTATSAPEGNEGIADMDGGYDFHFGALKVGPFAGLQYTHLTVDGYHENGSLADLTVNDDQSDSLLSRLGAHLRYPITECGMTITPHLEAVWQHEFMNQARGITSAFDEGGGDFTVQTPDPSRESAMVDVGVDADLNRTVSIFAEYLVQAGQENYFGQSVQAGVKIGF